MGFLRRYRLIWLFVGLLLSTVLALFVVYDRRSPVSQFFRNYGTVSVERWTADELDVVCIRLEPALGTPLVWAEAAVPVATKAVPGGHVRQVLLTSVRDTCRGGEPRLVWAVVLQWASPAAPAATTTAATRPPRAIVLVDAISGTLVTSRVGSP